MISFACGGCGRGLKVNDETAGKKSKCPQCGRPLRVPSASQPSGVQAPAAGGAEARTLPPRPTKSAAVADPETNSEATLSGGPADGGPPPEQYDFLAPPQAPDELGRLGPYRVLEVLGAGGMGVVFRAEDPMLKRPVALKAMLPTLAVSDSSKKRFLREAQAVAAIDHDHIVHVYQVGEDRGVPFLAMQFLKGEPLDERLKREGRLPVAEAVRIGAEIALGLGAAHAKGLIHRDVKPANVWLEGEAGRVKILDFGLARAVSQEAGLTQTGAIVGTPAYMAPEQANGQAVDARTDLFSLGCVLYRMTTGELPFKGTDKLSTLMAVAMDRPKPPSEVRPEVPAALSELVMRLLSKDPDGRPGSAAEAAEALRNAGAGAGRPRKGKAAAPAGEGDAEAPTRSLPGRWQTAHAAKDPRAVGNRVVVAAGVAGLSTLAVLVGVWLLSPPAHPPQTGPAAPAGAGLAVNDPFPDAGGAAPPPRPADRGGPAANARPPNAGGKTPPPVDRGPEPPSGALSFEAGWDAPVDPDGDCKFTPDKTALTIEAPGKKHVFAFPNLKMNAPRMFRNVDGDFTVQVRVSGEFRPSGPLRRPTVEAGLAAMAGDRRCALLALNAVGDPPKLYHGVGVSMWPADGSMMGAGTDISDAPTYLRLRRVGSRLLSSFSQDGIKWKDLVTDREVDMPARLKLGVLITTTSSAPFKARFDDFRLTAGGAPPAPADQAPPVVKGPVDDAWIKTTSARPADQQVRAVADELKKRNPGFSGRLRPTINGGAVSGLDFDALNVTDISPLRALTGLQTLRCEPSVGALGKLLADLSPLKGLKLNGLYCPFSQVSDLSPLKGMPLTFLDLGSTRVSDLTLLKGTPLTALILGGTPVSDLSPLKGMKLVVLDCTGTRVFDLSPLKGMQLVKLSIGGTQVSDLSPLKGMPLTSLECAGTKVSDLSPLRGSPLRWIVVDYKPERDAEILRSIKTLETINDKPAAEFWKDVDAKKP